MHVTQSIAALCDPANSGRFPELEKMEADDWLA